MRLRRELEEANRLYYVMNQPTLTDREFDEKMRRLQDLEAAHPEWYDANSPTQHVGSDLTVSGERLAASGKGFEQVKHRYPMLSLGNTYSRDEIADWLKKLPADAEIVAELKYDGLSIALWYENGTLVKDVNPRKCWPPKLCKALNNAFDGEPDVPYHGEPEFVPERITWTW